jgi:hypothetical protein
MKLRSKKRKKRREREEADRGIEENAGRGK